MDMESLKDLFVDELKDLYSAENQILKALPKMIKKATSKELKAGFEKHLKETEVHVERLETIFKELEESPKGKKCKGMEGVIADGKELGRRGRARGDGRGADRGRATRGAL
jgi:ferritin-like metal-binding protein YciE